MNPFYIKVGGYLPLTIIPDSEASADGHLVLTYTYSVFMDTRPEGSAMEEKKSRLHLERLTDPDYFGFITFEQPGRVFSYTANGPLTLTADQLQDAIEQITHFRDTPSLWII